MSEWLAGLAGNDVDLEYLCSEFSSDECSITKEGDRYYLRSARFCPLTDSREVRDSTLEVLEAMNGLSAVLWPSFRAVKLVEIARVDEEGKRHSFVFVEGSITLRSTVSAQVTLVKSNGTVDLSQRPSEAQAFLQSALENPSVVGQALKIFGSLGASDAEIWRSLYRVYDIIDDDIGEDGIVGLGCASSSKIGLFRRTAQPKRHYVGKFPPPKRPMRLRAARSLISCSLREWLRLRCQ